MIAPLCDKCGSELNDFGAIIFSPPIVIQNVKDNQTRNVTEKFHICLDCWKNISLWLKVSPDTKYPNNYSMGESVNDIRSLKAKIEKSLCKDNILSPKGFLDRMIDKTERDL